MREQTVVVVVVDSHIQRIVLATEETTATQQVSHSLSNANPARGHKEVKVNGSHSRFFQHAHFIPIK